MSIIDQGGFYDALATATSKTATEFCQAMVTFPQLGAIFLLTFFLLVMFNPTNRK